MNDLDVVAEALERYRLVWAWWLQAKHASPEERELARMKIALIDRELADRPVSP